MMTYASYGVCRYDEKEYPSLSPTVRSHFSRSVMVLVGVSVLGVRGLHFVNPGVKINGKYYRETLPKE